MNKFSITIKKLAIHCLSFPYLIYFLFVSCDVITTDKLNPNKPSDLGAKQILNESFKVHTNKNFEANKTDAMDQGVLSILQDKNENYWFGTNNGVYRYDGESLIGFTTIDGLVQNQVQDIQEDRNGKIWFSTGGFGVNFFNGNKIIVKTENASKNDQIEEKWKVEDGDIWFCGGGGPFCYSKGSFSYFPFPKTIFDINYLPRHPYKVSSYAVYSVLKDKKGNLWFGTQAMGVCRYDGKSFTWLTEKGLKGPAVLAIFEDRNGILWFGTNGKGLFRYDGSTLSNVTDEKGLDNPEFSMSGKVGPGTLARVWALNEDKNGILWIGTGDAGVWRYDGRNLLNYTIKDGLPDFPVEVIYKDKSDELWFGTNGDGVYNFKGNHFEKFQFKKSHSQDKINLKKKS